MNELAEGILAYARRCAEVGEAEPNRSPEFDQLLIAGARSAARYADSLAALAAGRSPQIQLLDCRNHVRGFLSRSHFAAHLPTDLEQATRVAEHLRTELNRVDCTVTSLVLLDGLDLPTQEIVFSGGRLVELDEAFLQAWFRGSAVPGTVAVPRLTGVAAVEVAVRTHTPPWGPFHFDWESDARMTKRTALPWLTYINLFETGKCSPIGMYQHSDSLLHVDEWRAVGVQEPMWETRSGYDGEDEYEYEALYRTLRIDEAEAIRNHLDALEAGRRGASGHTHRVETALRFFDRVSELYVGEQILSLGDNMDVNEDVVIDAVAGLEAIFLADEKRGKGQVIGMRASVILESDIGLQRNIRKQLLDLYALRSAILHGDARATRDALKQGALTGERLLRRSLVAFCRLGGDHARVVAAATDPATAEAVRRQLSA
jgi:hypothetical protein